MGNPNSKGRSILVVEDDQAIADMLTMMLEIEGYVVLWARSAQEAIRQLTDRAPGQGHRSPRHDLVLLDLQLPDMDGTEMIRLANSIGTTLPPVIVLSAGRNHLVEHAASTIQAVDVLVKPFEVRTLLERVTKALRQST